jgi:hypothetical protein
MGHKSFSKEVSHSMAVRNCCSPAGCLLGSRSLLDQTLRMHTRNNSRLRRARRRVPNPSSMSMIVRTLGRGCSLLARKLFRRQVEPMAPEWAIGTQARAARLRISCIAAMEAAAQSHLSRRASQAIPMLPRGTSFLDAEVLAAESPALRHGRRSRQPRCLLIFCTASRGSARRKLGHGLPTPKWRARRLYLPPALR